MIYFRIILCTLISNNFFNSLKQRTKLQFLHKNNFLLSSHKTMSEEQKWIPTQKIEELFAATAGNKFASINSPVAGARVGEE